MTDDNRRQNTQDEMRKADESLRAAGALLDLDLPADAAGRIYYAAYHAARALLFSLGLEGHSHRATRDLVSRHFVRPGLVDASVTKELAELEGLRMAGDYETSFSAPASSLRPDLERARVIVEAARTLLRGQGWLP